jgi:hypothetical protein
MNFKDLYLNPYLRNVANRLGPSLILFKDKRLRHSTVGCGIALVIFTLINILYSFQYSRLNRSVINLISNTHELINRLTVKRHNVKIPKFELSMKTMGAYQSLLSEEECAAYVQNCFLQKNKPVINVVVTKQDVHPTYTLQSLTIEFKSSFDYEMFDMMEYILSNSRKFGFTRLREFEIEQLFETSPVVKGRFTYDQLSLTP